MLQNWVGLGIGAVLGASLRFFITNMINKFWRYSFPIATFIINFSGSFLLSALFRLDHGPDKMLFMYMIGIGFLGSFTTFSTFTFETTILIERRAMLVSMSYLVISVVAGIFAAWLATAYL